MNKTQDNSVANVIKAFNQEVGAFNNVQAERFVREVIGFAQQVIQEMQERLDVLSQGGDEMRNQSEAGKVHRGVPRAESQATSELNADPSDKDVDSLMTEDLDAKASQLWERGARDSLGDAEFERVYSLRPAQLAKWSPEDFTVANLANVARSEMVKGENQKQQEFSGRFADESEENNE